MDAEERSILGCFRTEANRMVLHSDPRAMPRRRSIWSSWNYVTSEQPGLHDRPISLTYWMNKLQPLDTDRDMFVTLNPEGELDNVHDEATLHHPQYDDEAQFAQSHISGIQGRGGVYYAGAWTRYGFHEDGVLSALRVAQRMGIDWPLGRDPWAREQDAPVEALRAAE